MTLEPYSLNINLAMVSHNVSRCATTRCEYRLGEAVPEKNLPTQRLHREAGLAGRGRLPTWPEGRDTT